MPPDVVVGIDPDSVKSGFAVLNVATRRLTVGTFAFADLLDRLRSLQRDCEVRGLSLLVVVEAGWLNKSNWHVGYHDSRQLAAAKGTGVGRNQQTGILIGEMCSHWRIPHDEIKPLNLRLRGANLWSGKDGKITAGELLAVTGFGGRTNQEGRDAALIAWTYAGLPVKVAKTMKK